MGRAQPAHGGAVGGLLAAVVQVREPALDAAWWLDLVGRVSGMIVQVTALPEAARAASCRPS